MAGLNMRSFQRQTYQDDLAAQRTKHRTIVEQLKESREIITLEDLTSLYGKVPVELLCGDYHVEYSYEKDRFIYVSELSRKFGVFLRTKEDLLHFLQQHMEGIPLHIVLDSYREAPEDIKKLQDAGSIFILTGKHGKDLVTHGCIDKDIDPTLIDPNKPTSSTVFPATTLMQETNFIPIECTQIWQETPLPQTIADLERVLTENDYEVLPRPPPPA